MTSSSGNQTATTGAVQTTQTLATIGNISVKCLTFTCLVETVTLTLTPERVKEKKKVVYIRILCYIRIVFGGCSMGIRCRGQ